MNPTLGIVGGMGPLASAEFVRTLYEVNSDTREQSMPSVVLVSDPSIPDRTELLLAGNTQPVLRGLERALRDLVATREIARIVVCCVTSHFVIPRLPGSLQRRILSLVDVIADEIARSDQSHLILCTRGTVQLRILQSHPRWPEIADRVSFPSADDQQRLHDVIYRLKRGAPVRAAAREVMALAASYPAERLVVGCTEMHLVARELRRTRDRRPFLDPLTWIAENLGEVLAPTPAIPRRSALALV